MLKRKTSWKIEPMIRGMIGLGKRAGGDSASRSIDIPHSFDLVVGGICGYDHG